MVTSDQAQKIAKEAYVFTYPLVMYYRTMYMQAIDASSSSYSGGFGEWLHLGTSSPKDTDIVAPNNDTPYSYAWVDLRAEPWVLTLPKIDEKRFYTSQWDDLWGFVLDNVGSVNDGNDGVSVLLASPTWDGDVPDGIDRVVKGDSEFLGSLTRTQLYDADDLADVKKIQHAYHLEPLSAHLGQPAQAPAPSIDWLPWKKGLETTEEFWTYANFVMSLTTPNPQDKPVLDRIAEIGVVPGKAWDSAALGDGIAAAVADGMSDALKELKAGANKITDPSLFFRSRKGLDKDYWDRALGTLVGIFGNVKAQSVYYSVSDDAHGDLFDGSKANYSITFSSDQLPPVKYFWSWTMYKLPERWLVDNPIDRYSIGSATPGLRTADDGSITIHLQAESPGKVEESNWLPAPAGPCWLVLRAYGPGQAILGGKWAVPPVKRTK